MADIRTALDASTGADVDRDVAEIIFFATAIADWHNRMHLAFTEAQLDELDLRQYSAADQLQDLYEILTRYGLVVT